MLGFQSVYSENLLEKIADVSTSPFSLWWIFIFSCSRLGPRYLWSIKFKMLLLHTTPILSTFLAVGFHFHLLPLWLENGKFDRLVILAHPYIWLGYLLCFKKTKTKTMKLSWVRILIFSSTNVANSCLASLDLLSFFPLKFWPQTELKEYHCTSYPLWISINGLSSFDI